MSVSAILPSTTLNQAYNLQTPNQQQRTEFQQLTQALQSGNLSSAQQAFGALTNKASNSGLLSVQLSQDLSKLGSALQSGNLAGARQAYSSVQQNLQSSPPMAAHSPAASRRIGVELTPVGAFGQHQRLRQQCRQPERRLPAG